MNSTHPTSWPATPAGLVSHGPLTLTSPSLPSSSPSAVPRPRRPPRFLCSWGSTRPCGEVERASPQGVCAWQTSHERCGAPKGCSGQSHANQINGRDKIPHPPVVLVADVFCHVGALHTKQAMERREDTVEWGGKGCMRRTHLQPQHGHAEPGLNLAAAQCHCTPQNQQGHSHSPQPCGHSTAPSRTAAPQTLPWPRSPAPAWTSAREEPSLQLVLITDACNTSTVLQPIGTTCWPLQQSSKGWATF